MVTRDLSRKTSPSRGCRPKERSGFPGEPPFGWPILINDAVCSYPGRVPSNLFFNAFEIVGVYYYKSIPSEARFNSKFCRDCMALKIPKVAFD